MFNAPPFDKETAAALILRLPNFARGAADKRRPDAWDEPGVVPPTERLTMAGAAVMNGDETPPRLVRITGVQVDRKSATAGFDWYYVDTIEGVLAARPQHGVAGFKLTWAGWRLKSDPIMWADWDDVDGNGWNASLAD